MVAVSLTRLSKCRLGLAGLLFLTLLIVSSSSFAAPASSLLNWFKQGFTGQVATTRYDGKQYFAVSRGFGTIDVYNIADITTTPKPVKRFVGNTNDTVTTMDFSSSGRYLAVGGTGDLAKGNFIHIWDMSEGEDNSTDPPLIAPTYELTHSTDGIKSLLFYNDDVLIGLTDTADYTKNGDATDTAVKVWNVTNGTLVRTFTLPDTTFTCMTLAGRNIAVGDTDGYVHEWRLDDGLYEGTTSNPINTGYWGTYSGVQKDNSYWWYESTYQLQSGRNAVTSLAYGTSGLVIGLAPTVVTITKTSTHYDKDGKILSTWTTTTTPAAEGHIYIPTYRMINFGPSEVGGVASGDAPTLIIPNVPMPHSGQSPNIIVAGLHRNDPAHPYAVVTTWETLRVDPQHGRVAVDIDGLGPQTRVEIMATNRFVLQRDPQHPDDLSKAIYGYGIPSMALSPDGLSLIMSGTTSDNVVAVASHSENGPVNPGQPTNYDYWYSLAYRMSLPSNINPNIDYIPPRIGSFAVAGSSLFYGGSLNNNSSDFLFKNQNDKVYAIDGATGARKSVLGGAYNPDGTYNPGVYNPDVLAASSVKLPMIQDGHVTSSELVATVNGNVVYVWRASDGTLVTKKQYTDPARTIDTVDSSISYTYTNKITGLLFSPVLTTEGQYAGIRLVVAKNLVTTAVRDYGQPSESVLSTSNNYSIEVLKIAGTKDGTMFVPGTIVIPEQANVMAFSPDGVCFAFGNVDGVTVWNTSMPYATGTATTSDFSYPAGTKIPIRFFTRDNTLMMMVGEGAIDNANGKLAIYTITNNPALPGYPVLTPLGSPVVGFSSLTIFDISPDASKIITGDATGISLYSMNEFVAQAIGELNGGLNNLLSEYPWYAYSFPQEPIYHPGPINALLFAADGLSFYSGTKQFELANWKLPTVVAPVVTGAVQGSTVFTRGTVEQTVKVIHDLTTGTQTVDSAKFTVRVTNTGTMASRYRIKLPIPAGKAPDADIFVTTTDLAHNPISLTSALYNGGMWDGHWITQWAIEPGEWQDFTVTVNLHKALGSSGSVSLPFQAEAVTDPSFKDNIQLVIKTEDAPVVQWKVTGASNATLTDALIPQTIFKNGDSISTVHYTVRVINPGGVANPFTVSVTPTVTNGLLPLTAITVKAIGTGAGNTDPDITAILKGNTGAWDGSFTTPTIAAGGYQDFTIDIKLPTTALGDDTVNMVFNATSVLHAAVNDSIQLQAVLTDEAPFVLGELPEDITFSVGPITKTVQVNGTDIETAHFIVRVTNCGRAPYRYNVSIPELAGIATKADVTVTAKANGGTLPADTPITSALVTTGIWTTPIIPIAGYLDFNVDVTMKNTGDSIADVLLTFTGAALTKPDINNSVQLITSLNDTAPSVEAKVYGAPDTSYSDKEVDQTLNSTETETAHYDVRVKNGGTNARSFKISMPIPEGDTAPDAGIKVVCAGNGADITSALQNGLVNNDWKGTWLTPAIQPDGYLHFTVDVTLHNGGTANVALNFTVASVVNNTVKDDVKLVTSIKNLTSAQISSVTPAAPRTEGDEITIRASALGGSHLKYCFKVDGVAIQNTESNTVKWYPKLPVKNTAHDFSLTVDVTDLTDNSSVTSAAKLYHVDPVLSQSVTLTTDYASPRALLGTIRLMASAQGGAAVKYRFTINSTPAQDSAQSYYDWTPTTAGTYLLKVFVRDDNGINPSTEYSSTTIQYVVKPRLSSVALTTVDPVSPCPAGYPVTLAATATGGANLVYKFYAGSTVIRDFDAQPTTKWVPSQPGTYQLTVVAKDLNSANGLPVTVTSTAVKYVVTSAISNLCFAYISPASPCAINTPVSISVVPLTGGNFRYCFMEGNNVIQDGTSTTATWVPSQVGSYKLLVAAKDLNDPTKLYTTGQVTYTVKTPLTAVTISETNPSSPSPAKTNIVLTASATGGANVVYKFMAKVKDGEYTTIRDYSTAPTAAWCPTIAGDYSLKVMAKDLNCATPTVEVISEEKPYTVTGCLSSVTLAATPGTVDLNVPVTLTATVDGGVRPEYQFYVNSTMTQAFSAKNTATWTPIQAGTYTLTVVARDAGSSTPNVTVTSAPVTYTVTQPLSSVAFIKIDKQSPRPVGTNITLTAQATGGKNVQYKFMAGSTILRDFSTSATCIWQPATAGTYKLTVVAKDQNGTEVTSREIEYLITTALSTVTISSISPSTTGVVKNPVTITARATGGAKVAYRFMVGTTIIRDFSTASSVVWKPTKTGTYAISVVARDMNGIVSTRTYTSRSVSYRVAATKSK